MRSKTKRERSFKIAENRVYTILSNGFPKSGSRVLARLQERTLLYATWNPSIPWYSKAPITEAVIDIGVKLPEDYDLENFRRVNESNKDLYPNSLNSVRFLGQFTAGPQLGTSVEHKQIGYVYRHVNDREVYQATQEGFTFSRLAPYENWEKFSSEGKRIWESYRKEIPFEQIRRIALRYINRFDLPLFNEEIQTFLRSFPEIPAELPQKILNYFMMTRSMLSDPTAILALTQTTLPPSKSELVPVVLAVEVVRENDVPQDEDGLWNLLAGFRKHKHLAFEACITDKIRERIR